MKGDGFTGSTECVSGTVCTFLNSWFSRMLRSTQTYGIIMTIVIECIPAATTSTIQSTPPSTSPVTTSSPTYASSSASRPSSTPTSTGFVTTSGQRFSLNGEDYVVAGTNAYWLAQESDPDIETGFNDITAAGLTTVRTM